MTELECLEERLLKGYGNLRGLLKTASSYPEAMRLAGKIEGVSLALSYIEEIRRETFTTDSRS